MLNSDLPGGQENSRVLTGHQLMRKQMLLDFAINGTNSIYVVERAMGEERQFVYKFDILNIARHPSTICADY